MFFRGGFCRSRRLCCKIAIEKISLRSGAERSGAFQKRSGAKRSDKPTPRGGRSEAKRSEARRRAERSDARPKRSVAERGERRGERLCLLYIKGIMFEAAAHRRREHNTALLCKVERSEAERAKPLCGGNERSVAERVERSGVQKAA